MGVKDLSKELRASNALVSKLSDLSGKILGVDVSIWLNKALFSSPEICHSFHQDPKIAVGSNIEPYLNSMHSLFLDNDIKILFVLDGARNPLKAATNSARQKMSDNAKTEMTNLINTHDPEHMRKINIFKKKSLYVREDIVADFISWCDSKHLKYVCAFMEAEWELCRLEADGIIDGVVSEDSDCLVLGCKLVIQQLNKGSDPLGLNCSFVRRQTWVDLVSGVIPDPTQSEFSDFAVLLGVDYLDRASGNSLTKVKSFFGAWRTTKEQTLSNIESHGQVGPKRSRAAIPNYTATFKRASNIFQFAPCFTIIPTIPGQSLREAFWEDNYCVRRGNLRALVGDSLEATLFGFNPDDHLPSGFELKELYTMSVWIRTSTPIQQFAIPIPRNDQNQVLPWGCYLNFETVPINMQTTSALICYLECRGLSPRASNTRDQLNSAVERIVSQGDSSAPIIPLASSEGGGHYINLEVLTCSEPIVWETDSAVVFDSVRNLTTVFDEKFITEYFGEGRNGVRERAWRRVHAGHFDLRSLQSAQCKCRTQNGIEDVRIFSIKCTPSMKKDVYTVFVILRTVDDTFVQGPASRCNCPVGRLFCSHMLAFIVLFGMMKYLDDDEDWEWFVLNMPEPVKSLHSLCIPIEYVF